MAETPLARAVRLHLLRPEDDTARLRLFEVLSGAELVLPLAAGAEAGGEDVTPETLDLEGVAHVVAHDGLGGLAGEEPRPTATLSGLALAQMLEGQGAGLALRLGGMGEPFLVAPEALAWLARSLAEGPEQVQARPLALHPPRGLPASLLTALDRRLAQGEGLARAAWLAGVDWSDGTRGYLLAFVGTRPGAEEPLAGGINAAVSLSEAEGVRLDVTFLTEGDPVIARLARVALRFDLESPEPPPGGPPRLR